MFYAVCGDTEIGPFTTYSDAAFAAEAQPWPVYAILERSDEEDLDPALAA